MAVRGVITIPTLCPGDISALERLLQKDYPSEADFHRLLEAHPAILGVFGYVKLLSEQSLPKRDGYGRVARGKDRVDVLAVRPDLSQNDTLYVDLVELKAADKSISNPDSSQRLSDVSAMAISQISAYETELTQSDLLRAQLRQLGLNIGAPRKILVFGRDSEFALRPHDYELIHGQFRRFGVDHYTIDHVLRLCRAVVGVPVSEVVAAAAPREHIDLLRVGSTVYSINRMHDHIVSASGGREQLIELASPLHIRVTTHNLALNHIEMLATAAGLKSDRAYDDRSDIDITLRELAHIGGRMVVRGVGILDIVSIALSSPYETADGSIHVDIPVRRYDAARAIDTAATRLLMVSVFPNGLQAALHVEDRATSFNIATYCIDLRGAPHLESEIVSINVPRSNLVTPRFLLERIKDASERAL